jgi:hypothetical protein
LLKTKVGTFWCLERDMSVYLTTLPYTEIIWRRWWMNEIWVWNIGGVILTGMTQVTAETCGPVPLCPPQIPQGLAWDWIWSPSWGFGSQPRKQWHGLWVERMQISAVCVFHIVCLRAMNVGVKRRTQVFYPSTITGVHKSRSPGRRNDYIL